MSREGPVEIPLLAWLEDALRGELDVSVGWPDEPIHLRLLEADATRTELMVALRRFREHWQGCNVVVDISASSKSGNLQVRAARVPAGKEIAEPSEAAHREAMDALLVDLERLAALNGGSTYRGFCGGYIGLVLPIQGSVTREDFPERKATTWDAWYRKKLDLTSWGSLRHESHRFCDVAERIAIWAVANGKTSAMVPSVGLCAHPWLFADRGLQVIATDVSPTALAACMRPEESPAMYGSQARHRWHLSETAYSGGTPYNAFDRMPAIERPDVAESLRARIAFVTATWNALPLADQSIDVIFATNALPREDAALREQVLREWSRVTRPGGLVFVALHNAYDIKPAEHFSALGWTRIDALRGQPAGAGRAHWQVDYSSG